MSPEKCDAGASGIQVMAVVIARRCVFEHELGVASRTPGALAGTVRQRRR
jgi:hypothetical protein